MSERDTSPVHGEYAGYASRLCGFLIDSTILTAITVLGAWASVALLEQIGIPLRDCGSLDGPSPLLAELCRWLLYLGPLAGTGFTVAYALFFWSTTGQSPGKAAMGVRIVRLDGRPMNLATAARRLAGYVLSLWTLGFGFHVILADDRRQGWHDKIAGTCVVYSWDPPSLAARASEGKPRFQGDSAAKRTRSL
jgi:uncharacterized RDD family membrane protein YckC